ncbi:DoxX family protein [Microbacterium yannicii]
MREVCVAVVPDPVWPVVVLALIQLVDGLLCIGPVPFVARCFEDVGWPRRYWWIMPPLKFAAAAGLVAGIWIPILGVVTCGALVLYFVVAIAMHVRAKDFGRNLYLNATVMLLICGATGLFCFVI